MINIPTIDKLIEMRLTAMADAYLQQLSDPKMKEFAFEDRIGMMVDIKYTRRKTIFWINPLEMLSLSNQMPVL